MSAGWLQRMRVDTTPLRQSRDFRRIWIAGIITGLGSFVTYVAVPFQIKELTGSFVAVGLLGVVELVPLIVFGLYGGAIADAYDRRRVILLTEAGLLLASGLLLVNALLPEPALWPMYLAVALIAVFDSIQRPSLDAVVPRLVPHEQLPAATALISMKWQIASLAGPALGGFLAATVGAASAYGLDVVSFAISLLLLGRLAAVPPGDAAARPSLQRIRDGLAYAVSRRDLLGTYFVDIAAMLFAFPIALMPFVADDLDATWALGLLYTAPFVGSLLVSLTSGWTAQVHRHGRAIVLAAMAWGAAIAAFGLASNIWWALVFLVCAGAADMVSGLFRSVMWNQTIPDEVRGRMAGVELLSYSLGPSLGQIRSSAVAQATTLRFSLVSGGVACIAACGLIAAAMPSLWRYDVRTDPHAAARRADDHRFEAE